jgi:hypothetical protein
MAGTAVKYDGPHARVYVDVPGPRRVEPVEFGRGQTKTLPADLAERLLEGADWSAPTPTKHAPPPAKPAVKTLTTKTEPAPADAETREEK